MRFGLFSVVALLMLGISVVALAQGPPAPPPPTCEEQLNNEMFQKGAVTQQLAIAREQLRVITRERDDVKAALAKVTPKPDAAPKPGAAPTTTPEKK